VKKNNSIIPKSEDFNQSDINKNTKTSVVDRVRLSNLTSYYKMEVLLQKKKKWQDGGSTAMNNGGTVKSFWVNEFWNDGQWWTMGKDGFRV
jgi:hypothetical protein